MNKVPRSYDELPFKTYVAIINKIPSEKPEGIESIDWSRRLHLATLSVVLGITEAEVEQLKAARVMELIKAIEFLDVPFVAGKPKFKIKQIEELTFDEFSTYQNLRLDQWNKLEDILLLVCKDATPEDIAAMSIQDAMNIFFCLSASTKRFLTRLKYLTIVRIVRSKITSLLSRKK